ncbi:MAG TPA: hypothetical protein VHM70_32645 [Polyangiaceae bacterium]|jgi:hypothetical protein|nr:hypothetical protein [Polyangiaceae bacterium]
MPPSDHPAFEFREELLPLSLLITRRTLTVADTEPLFDYYRGLCQRRIRFVAISDVRASTNAPDAKTRKCIADHSNAFAELAKEWSVGSVIVVQSELIRGALTAIEWLTRPASPRYYCCDMSSAVDRATALLEQAGIPVTPAIRDFQARLTSAVR